MNIIVKITTYKKISHVAQTPNQDHHTLIHCNELKCLGINIFFLVFFLGVSNCNNNINRDD